MLLWASDAHGSFRWLNVAWLTFTGRSMEEALGLGWSESVHADDRDRRLTVERDAAGRGEPFEVEYRLRRHDGAWRWVLDRGQPQEDASGTNSGFVGACFDITERRQEERALLQSREDLRLALAAGAMGMWVWDRRTGRVTRDTNLQVLYGLGADASSGSFAEWAALVHPDDRSMVLAEVERAVAEGGTYELEHRVIRPDGEVRWLERRGEAFLDESGEVAGTRGLVIDITDRKRAEEERNRLLAAEREARRAAELAAGRLARLQAVTAGLADARTVKDVAEVIVTEGARGLNAPSVALCLLADDGAHLDVVRHTGFHLATMERFQRFPLDARLPASDAVRTGEMVLSGSLDQRDELYPALRGTATLNASFAAVPLIIDRGPGGAVVLGWHEARDFDDADRAFLVALSQQAAQALDRARFHEVEQDRARRQGFLAEASRFLGSSLDHEAALAELARLAVPTVADSCSIHLLDDGVLRTVVEVHAEPADSAADVLEGRPWCLTAAELLSVATGGDAVLVAPVDDDHLRAWAEDDRHLEQLRRRGTRSALAVPLRSGDQTLGVVVLGTAGSGRRYGPDDISFVEDLAARAAAAVANGLAHQARTAIAHTLQQSLLPPEVPIIPGLEVAARYRPVGHDVEVGGDFYDVFAAGGGRWGVVIGDVSGKGVPAASLTALARYTVRAAARREDTASAVLDVLNSSILDDATGDERFCTVALAYVRHGPDGVELSLSCGGQPLPLLVDDGGRVRPVGEPGTAIGLFANPSLADAACTLGPGELLVFYTDGVVEARSPEGGFADGLLEATLAGCGGQPAEVVARAVEDAVLQFGGGRPRDDVAILVLRRPHEAFFERLVPGQEAITRLRQRLRGWLLDRLPQRGDLVDDVVLVTNELATNAERVAHTTVEVHVALGPDTITVDVADDGRGSGIEVPPAIPPAPDALAGRGLYIVGRLALHCDVRSTTCGTLIRWVTQLDRETGEASG